jgi:hypothetical protein
MDAAGPLSITVSGAGPGTTIVQAAFAGVVSVRVPDVAATEKLWAPTANDEYVAGLVQAAGAPPSIVHLNVAGVRVEWKVNVAEVAVVVDAGAESITVSMVGTACAAGVTPIRSRPVTSTRPILALRPVERAVLMAVSLVAPGHAVQSGRCGR